MTEVLFENKDLKFGRFRQRMCDLLWECNCDHIGLSDESNAKNIFHNAHYICNELLKDYKIVDKER